MAHNINRQRYTSERILLRLKFNIALTATGLVRVLPVHFYGDTQSPGSNCCEMQDPHNRPELYTTIYRN